MEGFEVEVTWKRIKNLYLRVSPEGRVRVSAPRRAGVEGVRRFVELRRDWIEEQLAAPRPVVPPPALPTPEQLAAFIQGMDPLVSEWESRLGISVPTLRFRQMKTRWGSCNVRTRTITLNKALATHPSEAWEYVLVHELCHYSVADHGPRFKALMDERLPDWQLRRARLRG